MKAVILINKGINNHNYTSTPSIFAKIQLGHVDLLEVILLIEEILHTTWGW